jgi:hypothetical protein
VLPYFKGGSLDEHLARYVRLFETKNGGLFKMEPVIRVVAEPTCKWATIYFVSNVSDKRVWQGTDYMNDVIHALAHLFGCEVEMWQFTDEDEIIPAPPKTFAEIKGVERMGQA